MKEQAFEAFTPFDELRKLLKKYGNWYHVSRPVLVNLDRISEVSPLNKKDFTLISDVGHRFKLTEYFTESIKKHYGVKTLKHVIPYSRPHHWMMKMDIRDFDKNILYMSVDDLRMNFSTSTGTIVVSDIIANFLWQQVQYIRKGNPSPVEGGNVRSLWYLIKPVMSRLGLIGGSANHYKTLSDKLADMVKYKILSYTEFKLHEYGMWSIGLYNPNVILMAEKESHYYFLTQM